MQARQCASRLNIEADSVSIGGLSAGGHMSAVMSHIAKEEGVDLKLALMVVPSTDLRFDILFPPRDVVTDFASQLGNRRRAAEVASCEGIPECVDGGAQSMGSEVAHGLVHGPLDPERHRSARVELESESKIADTSSQSYANLHWEIGWPHQYSRNLSKACHGRISSPRSSISAETNRTSTARCSKRLAMKCQ
jgi:hypothetical protein